MQKLSVIKNNDALGWLSGVDAQDNTNWTKVKTLSFNGTVPSGSFDISNCTKILIECETAAGTTPSGSILMTFGSDTGASNYPVHLIYSQNNTVNGADGAGYGGFLIASNWGNGAFIKHEFDKLSKYGFYDAALPYATGNQVSRNMTKYIGTDAMNTLNIVAGTSTFTGSITVYKWQDVKVSSLASYELVKEYNLSNQTLNDTFDFDGETFDTLKVISHTSGAVYCRMNGDASSNYFCGEFYGASSNAYGHVLSTRTGLQLGESNASTGNAAESLLLLKKGRYRYSLTSAATPEASRQVELVHSYWGNTTAPVTSLTFYSMGAITGTVRVYKLVTRQLLKQNIQPIELVVNQSFNNQPVDITIDVTDCDIVEIEGFTPASANAVQVVFNGDFTAAHYVWEQIYAQGNTPAGQNIYNTAYALLNSSYSNCSLKIYPSSKTVLMDYAQQSGANWYVGKVAITWNQAGTVTNIRLYSGGANVTGKIKVYKKY